EQRLNHLAHHDVLTGLPNRLFFSVSLTQALERAKRYHQNLALLFIDLDRFKFINDTLGHAAGDLLLETVATRLKQCVRSGDSVARLGGDEFTITLSEMTHRDDAATLCKKVLHTISQPMFIDIQEVVISASIGVSLFPQDASCAEDLAKAADAAMYRAKEQGRDSYQFYSADLMDRAKEHLSLEQGLRQALAKNEFVLYYQPQFSLTTHKMVGVEALIRWQHPHLGLISPTKFIPIAEETGLIEPIGEWVLESVCQQIGLWRAAGLTPPRVGVNISGRQIMRENIVATIQHIFEKHGLKEHGVHIELELTESVLQIAECSIAVLHQLKSFGVTLAIDDFGTGYSSLSRLKHLPIDTLKIDRSFVSDIAQGADDGAIATAVIAMGRSLSLKVVAEGAETEEQVNFLRDQGCNEVQGFFLGRPVAVAEVTPLLTHATAYTVH
ncbi:MAG: hypothetical protein FD130_401, partial [Halothiobacillaceae bacterium]